MKMFAAPNSRIFDRCFRILEDGPTLDIHAPRVGTKKIEKESADQIRTVLTIPEDGLNCALLLRRNNNIFAAMEMLTSAFLCPKGGYYTACPEFVRVFDRVDCINVDKGVAHIGVAYCGTRLQSWDFPQNALWDIREIVAMDQDMLDFSMRIRNEYRQDAESISDLINKAAMEV